VAHTDPGPDPVAQARTVEGQVAEVVPGVDADLIVDDVRVLPVGMGVVAGAIRHPPTLPAVTASSQ
jgi:hypothetical protein